MKPRPGKMKSHETVEMGGWRDFPLNRRDWNLFCGFLSKLQEAWPPVLEMVQSTVALSTVCQPCRSFDSKAFRCFRVYIREHIVQHSRGQSVPSLSLSLSLSLWEGKRGWETEGWFQSALQHRYWFQVRWCRSAWTYDRRSIDITMPVQTVCSGKSRP